MFVRLQIIDEYHLCHPEMGPNGLGLVLFSGMHEPCVMKTFKAECLMGCVDCSQPLALGKNEMEQHKLWPQ